MEDESISAGIIYCALRDTDPVILMQNDIIKKALYLKIVFMMFVYLIILTNLGNIYDPALNLFT